MSRFDDLLVKGKSSAYFKASYDLESYERDMALSERQLFTQSNGRVLLGQDTLGRMHFIAAPHELDYVLPTGKRKSSQHITACPGMYYQTDLTLFLGKMRYQLESEDGNIFNNAESESVTMYWNDFLPWTKYESQNLRMDTFCIAPILEKPGRHGLKTLPLPGPSGGIYGMRIKNIGDSIWRGNIRLCFSDLFMSKYEHCGKPVETRAYPAQYMQVDRGLLLMQRPEGYTGLWMKDGVWDRVAGEYTASVFICLKPGEEYIAETNIVVSQSTDGISEAMSLLYIHSGLEWIEITNKFWKKYLGNLTVGIRGQDILAQKSQEMHIRSILDNFNCVQMDENGRVLVNWQGAPSHCMGRMWGIDVEPTALSFIHIFPELGEKLLEYMVDHNEPGFSPYQEHSIPIMMAPLVIAGEYYRYTGNTQYFMKNSYVLQRLDEIWEKITQFCKKDCSLVPSRYSSDGIVMRRYDHGTNAKFWYASILYGEICEGLGREKARIVFNYAEQLKDDIEKFMVVDGPFGKQISGGTNLGEQENFYMDEDFLYYDGEDSSSALAPVYGIYDFSYAPWINYHRFARSLFCSNYDPEMDTLRWFPYGGALDGTAYVSQLGGAITKEEMGRSLKNLISAAVDETGSLYWWPKGENKRRMIARCSQGQGSWIVQYIKQWLGIKFSARDKVLRICPQGLLDRFVWEGACLGGYVFDLTYEETEEKSQIKVRNHTDLKFQVIFGCRSYGAGAQGDIQEIKGIVLPGEELILSLNPEKEKEIGYFSVEKTELERFAEADGILLQHFGFKQPYLESEEKKNIFLLSLVLGNSNESAIENVSVLFSCPSGMKVKEKPLRIWEECEEEMTRSCTLVRNRIDSMRKTVLPVWIEVDTRFDASEVWFDGHPFMEGEKGKSGKLWIASEMEAEESAIHVKLLYELNGAQREKELEIPVSGMAKKKLLEYAKSFLGSFGE